MKKTLIAAVALAMASLAGTAHAEKPSHGAGGPRGPHIEALDTNGDGAVSREEFEEGAAAKAAKFFEKLDTNGDGVLTKADNPERSGRRDRAERKGGDAEGKGKPWKHRNHDGEKERPAE
jgi:hypothetical protein|nr:hypothetical protein [Neorhizobium tomejilense]